MPVTLNERIANFYDQSTKIWLDTWGEHMHHGYYSRNEIAPASHQEAQVRLGSRASWTSRIKYPRP